MPARYALSTLYQSRLLLGFTVLCYVAPIVLAVLIYLQAQFQHHGTARTVAPNLITVDANFFAGLLSVQGFLAVLLTAYAGPGLISPDLSNNALPLYFCRPISRTEYVIGKMMVFLCPCPPSHGCPGVLWALEASLEGNGWGTGESEPRDRHVRRFLALGFVSVPGCHGAFCLGALEVARQRSAIRHFLHHCGV